MYEDIGGDICCLLEDCIRAEKDLDGGLLSCVILHHLIQTYTGVKPKLSSLHFSIGSINKYKHKTEFRAFLDIRKGNPFYILEIAEHSNLVHVKITLCKFCYSHSDLSWLYV